MASVPLAAAVLIGLGIDELSVIPSMFSEIKQIVRATNIQKHKLFAEEILTLPTESQIKSKVTEFFNTKIKPQLL